MKKTRITLMAAVILWALSFCSCTKTEIVYVDKEVIKEVPVTPLCSYTYDGKEYSVHTLGAAFEEGYYTFLIAREPQKPYNSYLNIMIPDYNMGRELDFGDPSLSNRIDYVILFEDLSHYYSPYFAPQSGKMKIKKASGKNAYKIEMDVILRDGKPFSFNYEGDF